MSFPDNEMHITFPIHVFILSLFWFYFNVYFIENPKKYFLCDNTLIYSMKSINKGECE